MDGQLEWKANSSRVGNATSAHNQLFSLNLLGKFELLDAATGERVAVTSRKSRALLAYLATAPGHVASRSALAALLWGDTVDEQARQSLRQALSNLRRIKIGSAGLLKSDDETIQLDSAMIGIDCVELFQLADHADLADHLRICATYRGPFGDGLEVQEPGFDDWLRAERQRFADRAVMLHDSAIRRLIEVGRPQDALGLANALLTINPFREETHRTIIALEAQFSGRAAAMQRFEAFRLLLRDELAVRPESATIRLIDQLRDSPAPHQLPNDSARDVPDGFARQPPRLLWLLRGLQNPISIASALAVAALLIYSFIQQGPSDLRTVEDQRYGRALLALEPIAANVSHATRVDAKILNREATLAFSRNNKVSLIEFVDGAKRRPDYRIHARIVEDATNSRAVVELVSLAKGNTIWSGSIPLGNETSTTFARELHGFVTSEIVLSEAGNRASGSSIPDKLWRAKAAQIQTRLGTDEPKAMELYREILGEDPTNVNALIGLSEAYILRVARNQTSQRAADLAAISELLIRMKPLVPNSSDAAFKEGMLNKLQGKFQQASANFEQSVRLDPAHWNAAAQYAHVMIFLGRLEEGYRLMQAATPNLLPDLGAAETAYIAGETALVAGHAQEAARYLGIAVSGNPTVGRIQALYAVALFRSGHSAEARMAVEKARELSPGYTPDVMNQRGGQTAHPRYAEAKSAMVEAFRQVRAMNQID